MYRKTYIYYDSIEREYKRLFGIYPDDEFMQLDKIKGYDIASKIVNGRADEAWQSLKQRLEKEEKEAREREENILLKECPF